MIANLIIAAALAAIRIAGHQSEAFQAVAHLYVGGLFTAAYIGRNWPLFYIGVAISLIELAVGLWQRFA
jgi:hypothetical protein